MSIFYVVSFASRRRNYSNPEDVFQLFHLYVPFQLIRLKQGTGFVTQYCQTCKIEFGLHESNDVKNNSQIVSSTTA
jgi:hypothetical protein